MSNKLQYQQKYRSTYKGRKVKRISDWKRAGIVFHDYDLLYDIFMDTKECEFCKCELDTEFKTRKCCDHDHKINDDGENKIDNVRGILCHSCNIRDVYSTIELYLSIHSRTIQEQVHQQMGQVREVQDREEDYVDVL